MHKGSDVRQAVWVFVWCKGQTLQMRRQGTGFMNGLFGPPSGHVEKGERPRVAGAREVYEETGIVVRPESLQFMHVRHRFDEITGDFWINYFFDATIWTGEPKIMEPDKCSEMQWASYQCLHVATIPFIREVLELTNRGVTYSEG